MADTHRVWQGDSEASIDSVNQWMRSQPWYQQQLQAWGQDPNNVHLSDQQRQQIVRLSQANGAVVDEGHIEVDPSGNFNPKGHKLRNALIGAGLGAGAIFGAPALIGALGSGAGAGAAGAAGAAGSGAAGAGYIGSAIAGTANAALGGGALSGGGILGTLAGLGSRASDLGSIFSQGAAANAAGRRGDTMANAELAAQNNRARLDAATFNRDTPAVRASQVARGNLLATMQNAAPTGDPRIDKFGGGGLRPSAVGADARQAGDQLARQGLAALMTGSDRLDPQMAQPQRAGLGENLMAGAGLGFNVLGALSRLGGR